MNRLQPNNIRTRLAALSPAQRQLFEQKLKQHATTASARTLQLRPHLQHVPLSFAHERMWILEQLEPDTCAYNRPQAYAMDGSLNAEALQLALTGVVRRHDALRTIVDLVAGEPAARIDPVAKVDLPMIDLSALPGEQQEQRIAESFQADAHAPFDMACAPLLRAQLLRRSATSHVLLLDIHHAVSDGWSDAVFWHDLSALYNAHNSGDLPGLPELPAQYADYAHWQRHNSQHGALANQIRYWQGQLAGPHTPLFASRQHTASSPARGATLHFHIGSDLLTRLKGFSGTEGVTLFMTLLAAYNALLHRYTNVEDVLVGTPTAGRSLPESEAMIGAFLNTLVMRSNVNGNSTFRALLQQVRDIALKAYANQDAPFEAVVQAVNPARDLNCNPLFQVMFNMRNLPPVEPGLCGVRVQRIPFDDGIAQLDLTLEVTERNGGLDCAWVYSMDVFDVPTIERMAAQYAELLAHAVSAPDTPIHSLRVATAEETKALLTMSRGADSQKEQPGTIHHVFERVAAELPDATAVCCDSQSMTYAELNARGNVLARTLIAAGVGRDSRVAICLPRGLALAVALVGVMKAGGAYVPIDPAYPDERRRFMLDDSQAVAIITSRELGLEIASNATVIYMDDADTAIGSPLSDSAFDNPDIGADSTSAAYVLYTSGSTGMPKGVVIEHGAALSFVLAARDLYRITPADRFLQFTSISWDVHVEEFYATWLAGATVVMRTDEMLGSAHRFAALCAEWNITIFTTSTAFWLELAAACVDPSFDLPACTRLVVIGGERVLPERAIQWQRRFGHRIVLSHEYGVTEASVSSTVALLAPDYAETGELPIGTPFRNSEAYVLGVDMQLLPVGMTGELYLGGAGLARGYLNRETLTRERFVASPFDANARLYRTGDLARWRGDGQLEFLGRADEQVKVRGIRIEPGEIETVLARHPSVQESVVIVREDVPGDKRIVAYVTAASGHTIDDNDFLQHIAGQLPEYLVPSSVVVLDTLPYLPNGKINRRALPAPRSQRVRQRSITVPRTDIEVALHSIWQQVLKVQDISVCDSFFSLGCHSLLAMQLLSRVRDALNVDVTVKALFEAPTIESFARHIASLEHRSGASLPPITADTSGRPAPLSFAQQQLWFLDALEGASATYNMPYVAWLDGPLDGTVLKQALTQVVRRHGALCSVIRLHGSEAAQIVDEQAYPPHELIDLQNMSFAARVPSALHIAHQQANQPFELAHGPLMRTTLVRVDDARHLLIVVQHHIISDGWSHAVFLRDLSTAYNAIAAGRTPDWAEIPFRYSDFAAWQREVLRGPLLDTHLGFWRTLLDGLPPLLQLPTDRPRPEQQTFRGARVPVAVPAELTSKLRSLGAAHRSSLFMTLLAVFNVLMQRHSGQDDFAVGTPTAGRTQTATENMIGLFLNTLVLRAQMDATTPFATVLADTRDQVLSAFAHQNVPFEKLVEELSPSRSLAYNPLFQVMFALQNMPPAQLALTGIEANEVTLPHETAKFDISLSLEEKGDEITGWLEFNTDLFDAATAVRMTQRFITLAESACATPTQPIAMLNMLDEDERQLVVSTWNQTSGDYPRAAIHHLFEAQVKDKPRAVALIEGGRVICMAELNARANRQARKLIALGVRHGTPVAIFASRSIETVCAMLAVLKAGGAWLPLDPAYPRERIAFMLQDSEASVILTTAHYVNALPQNTVTVMMLDDDSALREYADHDLDTSVAADDLACVIYTSGSTGNPKGVLATHRGAVNRFAWMWAQYPFAADDVCCHKTALSFVDSIWEIFGPLLQAVPNVILDDAAVRDPSHLIDMLTQHKVTRIVLVPSLLRAVLAVSKLAERLPALRFWISSGEALSGELAAKFTRNLPGCALINLYGSSEVAADATAYEVTAHPISYAIPIGKPIANMRAYVLDRQLLPMPVGVLGDLYVGGHGVARGYLHRDVLTSERFMPNPFVPGETLYKTGDLARWLNDGNIEYAGRNDFQVKVRGVRIELGEVETAISKHAGVKQCAVVLQDNGTGARLAAFATSNTADAPSPEALREHTAHLLPEFMVPATLTVLEAMPMTPNGKLDRKALQAMRNNSGPDTRPHIAPQSITELCLARIWRDILHLDNIGITDSFFALGGHSLLSIELFARIEQEFGQRLPISTLFEGPTIQQLARALEGTGWTPNWSSLVFIQPNGTKPAFFCVHEFDGNAFYYNMLSAHLGPDQPFYGLQAQGLDGTTLPHASLEEMAAHYINEIRTVQSHGPYFLGGSSLGGTVAYEMAQQLMAQGEKVGLLAIFDTSSAGFRKLLDLPLRYRATRHLDTLVQQGPRGALEYLARHAASRLDVRRRLREHRERHAPTPQSPQVERVLSAFERDRVSQAVANTLLEAHRRYEPRPYRGRVTFFHAKEQDARYYHVPIMTRQWIVESGFSSRADADALLQMAQPQSWGALALGGIDIHKLPGAHGWMMRDPDVKHTAAVLQACLAHAQAES